MTDKEFMKRYMWRIFDIEKCKSIAYQSTLISSDREILYPTFSQYTNLASMDSSMKETFVQYQNLMVEKVGCSLLTASDIFISSLKRRGYKGFYGESVWAMAISNVPGYQFITVPRGVDQAQIDGLVKKSDSGKKYLSIKSDWYLFNDMAKIRKEKVTHICSNLDAPAIHVFYNYNAPIPYFLTENKDYFYMPNFKLDIVSFEKYLTEKVMN